MRKKRSSRLVIDPKGELCAITYAAASQYSEVVIIDPFDVMRKHGVTGLKRVSMNPLAPLDPNSLSFGGDVETVTDGVFVRERGGGENAAFFHDSAVLLFSAAIRALLKYGAKEKKNLVSAREEVCRDVYQFANTYANCGDPVLRDELNRYTTTQAKRSKTIDDIVSTLRTQTSFIGLEGLRQSLVEDNFRWLHMKQRPMTVYVILPLNMMSTTAIKWFRLCMSTALSEFLKAGPGGLPVLLMIDEFFSVCAGAPIKTFETAMSQAPGAADVQLWPVIQDLSQLDTMMGRDAAKSFLSSAAVKIFFGGRLTNNPTAEEISKLCGEHEVIVQSRSISGRHELNVSDNANAVWQRLFRPHQVQGMNGQEMIVIAENVAGPIHGRRAPYFGMKEFRGLFRRNPYYPGGK